jgi:Fur family iron response transcriptional regulator
VEIAAVLLSRPQHLSADQIIDRLKSLGSRVSKATVYNSLNLFSEKGLVREINVDPARKYYDSTTHPHHHFYHVGTGELVDIANDRVGIPELPPLPRGTEQESVEVLIRIRDRER